MDAPERTPSWWLSKFMVPNLPLLVPDGLMGLCGKRMDILKPMLLCHECPALGGMDVFVRSPKHLDQASHMERYLTRTFEGDGPYAVRRHSLLRSLFLYGCVSN